MLFFINIYALPDHPASSFLPSCGGSPRTYSHNTLCPSLPCAGAPAPQRAVDVPRPRGQLARRARALPPDPHPDPLCRGGGGCRRSRDGPVATKEDQRGRRGAGPVSGSPNSNRPTPPALFTHPPPTTRGQKCPRAMLAQQCTLALPFEILTALHADHDRVRVAPAACGGRVAVRLGRPLVARPHGALQVCGCVCGHVGGGGGCLCV